MLRTLIKPQILNSAVSGRLLIPVRTLATQTSVIQQQAESRKYEVIENMPRDVFREVLASRSVPMREEFMGTQRLTTDDLESIDFGPGKHHNAKTLGDKAAYRTVRFLRLLPDTYFKRNHYMRAVMLETIAAVPGMVGGMLRHMKSLRNLTDDNGWIDHMLHEAANERFHLMTWMKCLEPSRWNRLLILGAQGVFFNAYFWLYVCSPKVAHRFCGYLEEEAVVSYTHFLTDLDNGYLKNEPAPTCAIGKFNDFLIHQTNVLKQSLFQNITTFNPTLLCGMSYLLFEQMRQFIVMPIISLLIVLLSIERISLKK